MNVKIGGEATSVFQHKCAVNGRQAVNSLNYDKIVKKKIENSSSINGNTVPVVEVVANFSSYNDGMHWFLVSPFPSL